MFFKPADQVIGEACVTRTIPAQDDIYIKGFLLGVADHRGKLIQCVILVGENQHGSCGCPASGSYPDFARYLPHPHFDFAQCGLRLRPG